MTDNLERHFASMRRVSLTERERNNMRLALKAHMHMNPANNSWLFGMRVRAREKWEAFENAFNSGSFLTHPTMAAFVLVLFLGVGTSFAAQGALPGEALYAFKTKINEPLAGVIAFSPQAKAEWSAELTNRRLHEAEELAATGSLSPVASADIEFGLENAVHNFNSSVELLSKKDDIRAVDAQTDLEASLNAHEVVLSALPVTKKSDASALVLTLRNHAQKLSDERHNAETVFTSTNTPQVKNAALKRKKSAQDAVDQTQLLTVLPLETQVASSVASITAEATSDISVGDDEVKNGHWGKAYGAFQDAIRKMKETQDSVDTRNWLKKEFGIGFNVEATSSTSSYEGDGTDDSTTTDSEDK